VVCVALLAYYHPLEGRLYFMGLLREISFIQWVWIGRRFPLPSFDIPPRLLFSKWYAMHVSMKRS
jgi:hypothetical protein